MNNYFNIWIHIVFPVAAYISWPFVLIIYFSQIIKHILQHPFSTCLNSLSLSLYIYIDIPGKICHLKNSALFSIIVQWLYELCMSFLFILFFALIPILLVHFEFRLLIMSWYKSNYLIFNFGFIYLFSENGLM